MKKLFTFFAAMALVSMSFAQLNEWNVSNVQNPGVVDRSEWYGFTSNSSSAFIFDAEAEYLLRVPAGDLVAGTSVTKVMFQHLTSENFSGYTGDPFGCEQYTIKIYTGTNYVPVTYIGSDELEHTYDSLNPGVVAYSMNYVPTETGQQIVTLSAPFTVPSADFCVSIYAADPSAGGLCPTDTACATQSYAFMDEETGWWHYQFGNNNIFTDKPWYLAIFNDDGQPIVHKCDWKVALHDPDDQQTFTDEIESLYIDSYVDSLYLAFEMGNMGPDTAYGHVYFDCYIECNGVQTDLITDDDWDLAETTNGYMLPGYGWWAVDAGGLFDFENDFVEMGLSFPFQLCIHCDWQGNQSNDYDPLTENNTYCITVTDQDPDAINENTNTLTVSPNPASNMITVSNAAGSQISIYNIAGQEVLSINASDANETINVSNLSEGMYIVRVVNGEEVSTSKVSIVR